MIGKRLIHIGIGSTTESAIRYILNNEVEKKGLMTFIDNRAHVNLREARKLSDAPAFTFVRNPWDWYISLYIQECRVHRWQGPFWKWFAQAKSFADTFEWFTNPGIDFVGRYENYANDLSRIFTAIAPDIFTDEMVQSWFPQYFSLNGSLRYPWQECMEQSLRSELFTRELCAIVQERDAKIIKIGNYSFDQYYDFPPHTWRIPEEEKAEHERLWNVK